MAEVLSKYRITLIRYLVAIGCKRSTIWQITMLDLEEEEAILDMLQFCKENHPNLSEAKLLEMSSKISLRYKQKREGEAKGTL